MSPSSLLFLAVLAVVPIQLGKFFWPNYSFVLGIPIDYRALTLYLSDLVVIAYLVIFIFENFKNLSQIFRKRREIILVFFLFNLYLIINSIFFSISPIASLVFSLRFLMLSFLAVFGSITFSLKRLREMSFFVIGISLLWQSTLIILQFISQRSLGLWFLGERAFDSSTTNIAHTSLFGNQLLRSYGTFPHPNVASAFLIIYLLIYVLGLSPGHKFFSDKKWFSTIRILILLVSLTAIVLTFSKTAVLAFGLFLAIFLKSPKKLFLVALFLVLVIWLFVIQLKGTQLASIAERLLLNQAALDIALINPLVGVGSNNFILELSKLDLSSLAEVRLLQPVHDIFLLILAENGVIGFLIFAILVFVIFKNTHSVFNFGLLVIILVFASVDHFLWTLQQGQLLLAISIGYIVGAKNVVRKSHPR